MSIYLTGASGFVGKNLISYFKNKIEIKKHVRGSEFLIKENTVIHLAGKAHDLKNISNKDSKLIWEVLLTPVYWVLQVLRLEQIYRLSLR